jgi:hypothetical protein
MDENETKVWVVHSSESNIYGVFSTPEAACKARDKIYSMHKYREAPPSIWVVQLVADKLCGLCKNCGQTYG